MRKLLFVVFILTLFAGASFAADSITFSGELTVNGQKINGKGTISMPQTKAISTQDDDPEVMAGLFESEGYTKSEAEIKINTSKSFTVSGSRVNGIFAIKSGKLKSIAGRKAPYKVPATNGDYYIGIKNTPEDEKLVEEQDAAILQYIKISVSR